ncbi:MAG: Arylsulfatase [Planctomycetota bacterium]|nr:Arylsulfatase [Planctomycetota bacterium]
MLESYGTTRPGRSALAVALTLIATGLLGTSRTTSASGAGADPPQKRRPSVLMILPDQMRGQALGCMGNPDVRTPNLDRLASQGLLFRNALANTPVCCPARANLLTGKYAHRNGMIANDLRLRESERTIAEILAEKGYRTGFVGKWHLDGGPRLPGFIPPGPRRQGFAYWAANECDHRHFRPTYFRDTDQPITEERFEPEVWTDRAVEFLRLAGDDPFFLVVSMGPPHDPYGAPEKSMKLYDPAKLTMRPNWVEGVSGAGRKELAAYYAAITAVDEQVGRLLKTLDDTGRAEDTIVIVTSDHGDMLGSHGQRLKRKPFEESIRVPGIIRYPAKVKPGRTTEALLTHVDVAPTLLSLCGLPVPSEMQGRDLSGVVLGTTDRGPDSAFFQIFVPFAGDTTPRPWRGVRTDRYMYARTQEGPWLLFDLKADPYELKNLAKDSAHTVVRDRMEAMLVEWMKRTGDSWANDSMASVEDNGRLYRFRAFYSIREYLDWAKKNPEVAPKD